MGTAKVTQKLLINFFNYQCCQNAQSVLDLTIFKAPYSLTSKNSNLKKKGGESVNRTNNNEYTSSPEPMETIMEDVLALLFIDVSYKERVSQINNLFNQQKGIQHSFPQLNLTVVSSSLNYDQNMYIITPYGLKNSKRNRKDGIVLFGYERRNNKKKRNK